MTRQDMRARWGFLAAWPVWLLRGCFALAVVAYAGEPAAATSQPPGKTSGLPTEAQFRAFTNSLVHEAEQTRTQIQQLTNSVARVQEEMRSRFKSVTLVGTLNLLLVLGAVGGAAYLARSHFQSARSGATATAAAAQLQSKLTGLEQKVEEGTSTFTKQEAQQKEFLADVRTQVERQTALLHEKLATTQLEALSAKAGQISGELDALKQDFTALKERVDQLNQALAEAVTRLTQKDELTKGSVWPKPFLESGSLAAWKGLIEKKLERSDPVALGLFSALVRFNWLARQSRPSGEQIAEALHGLSVHAYQFWRADSEQWDLTEATQNWRQAFQGVLDSLDLPLDIKLIFAKDRFDMNTMRASEDASESRISVQEPLSWIIRDKSGPVPTVLHHGRVTTC
jgi:polyhydroxyalkanoate synthesis regulator phasin